MKWVRDTTGRFEKRPHYSTTELDAECERIVSEFLIRKHGRVNFPITTDDLTCLLERDSRSLDLYADLSQEEGQVEGVTEFRFGQKPLVRISATLTESPYLQNRLRTTLTHEYGHVRFHDFLFQVEERSLSLFERDIDHEGNVERAHRCKRDSMVSLSQRDWMEWQAGFVCGALLAPVTALYELVRVYRRDRGLDHASIACQSVEGTNLTSEVSRFFEISREAARVRLVQKSILSAEDVGSLY